MNQEAVRFRKSLFYSLGFILILWMIKFFEYSASLDLGFLGIYPRSLKGSLGIITGPMIHGDLVHLLSNSFPLLFLGIGVVYFYEKIAIEVFLWIYLMTGFWVWISAREAYHIGASGITYGLVSFLFFSGIIRKNPQSISISLIIMFLYGGMIYGLFPVSPEISWESHLLGSIAGLFCAFYFRKSNLFNEEAETISVETEHIKENTNYSFEPINSDLKKNVIIFNYIYKSASEPSAQPDEEKEEEKVYRYRL